MGLHNLLKPGPRDLVQLTREVGKCSSEVLQPHWSTTEQGKRKDHSWSTSWGQTDPETVPYKSRQGQHIKEDLSLSSKKELSISITNSPCGWIIIRFTEYFTGEKGTLAPPPPPMSFPIFFVPFTAFSVLTIFCGRWQSPEHHGTRSTKCACDFCTTEIWTPFIHYHIFSQTCNEMSLWWRPNRRKSSEMLREVNGW